MLEQISMSFVLQCLRHDDARRVIRTVRCPPIHRSE
jgi:hypothetical protein